MRQQAETGSARWGTALAFAAGAVVSLSAATAQTVPSVRSSAGPTEVVVAMSPRSTLAKMSRPVSLDVTDARLEDVITFIASVTTADIEPAWRSESVEGLDKEKKITLSVKNVPALDLLERVLSKAQTDFQQNTWQLSDQGVLEIGPKDRLNKNKRLVIYDINDLLTEIPNFYDNPQIDLQGVLQQSGRGGGGGGQSPFRDDQQNNVNREEMERRKQERVDAIKNLITALVEPEQWTDNGGDGGSIRYFQGTFIVNAPDYMHRQINGYPFWPSHTSKTVNGRRYVSLNMDTGVSKVKGFANQPVTATVGGQGGRGGGGGGGP